MNDEFVELHVTSAGQSTLFATFQPIASSAHRRRPLNRQRVRPAATINTQRSVPNLPPLNKPGPISQRTLWDRKRSWTDTPPKPDTPHSVNGVTR